MKDVSFLVYHDDVLAKAIEGVGNVCDMLLQICLKCNGLPLRNSLMKKKLKPNWIKYHQVFTNKQKKFLKTLQEKDMCSLPRWKCTRQERGQCTLLLFCYRHCKMYKCWALISRWYLLLRSHLKQCNLWELHDRFQLSFSYQNKKPFHCQMQYALF